MGAGDGGWSMSEGVEEWEGEPVRLEAGEAGPWWGGGVRGEATTGEAAVGAGAYVEEEGCSSWEGEGGREGGGVSSGGVIGRRERLWVEAEAALAVMRWRVGGVAAAGRGWDGGLEGDKGGRGWQRWQKEEARASAWVSVGGPAPAGVEASASMASTRSCQQGWQMK